MLQFCLHKSVTWSMLQRLNFCVVSACRNAICVRIAHALRGKRYANSLGVKGT